MAQASEPGGPDAFSGRRSAGVARPRRGMLGALAAALARIAMGLAALALAGLVMGLFAPLPSTLMLWRHATGQTVDRVWTGLDSMSPELLRAVIAAEDQRFCAHRGVDWGALGEVLADEGGPRRGASTITMQTVKNLYLWHGRSALRKGLELPLALAADLVWSKRRTLELYLNVAEFGEGLFGAEAASRRYFGKGAAALSRREAAQLAAALPNPGLRNPGAPSRRARTNALAIQQRSSALGDLADCVLRGAERG